MLLFVYVYVCSLIYLPLSVKSNSQIATFLFAFNKLGFQLVEFYSSNIAQSQRYITNRVDLDIAGTAMDSTKSSINQSWASGWGVRLLNKLVADNYEKIVRIRLQTAAGLVRS